MRHGDTDQTSQFGFLVRAHRRRAGLTQEELAAKAGLSVAALRDFEQARRRRPRANSLAALADALRLDPEQAASLSRAVGLPRQRPVPLPAPRPLPGDFRFARTGSSPQHPEGLWLATLGPLEAWGNGTPLPLGPPARRAVLGLLLMGPDVLVRRDTIIDTLWGDSPPRTAVGLVQAHVSRIRRLLSAHSSDGARDPEIGSVGGAYRLTFYGQEVDLLVFRDLAARGAAARAAGDNAAAVAYYGHAVDLWRGDPLADVDVLSGHPNITALRQELTGALLRYAEVACALGQPSRVLPRLRALADAEPLNEPAHARLMIALAGSGQQADALRVYEDLRTRLDRELGIYPGGELAEAYMRVLRQDIAAGNQGRPPVHPRPLPVSAHEIPKELPTGPRSFVGRARELSALSALAEPDLGQSSGVAIAALTGMAGIGKTALAMYWAHQVAGKFPDGQLFVNLRGSSSSGASVTPTDAVSGFLIALGVLPARIPPDTDGQAALYRSLLADQRMLIVLDNAQNAEQVRPLLPGSPGCLVLVTSRNRLTGLAAAEGAYLMTLGVLTEAESYDLLAANLGSARATAEPAAVRALAALCSRLPLALCDAAARAIARPGLPLSALVTEMRNARGRLDALETGEPVTSVRMVFSWSRARLGPAAARMFRLLGVHPGPDITVRAAASLAGLPPGQAYSALAGLCDEHLLTEHVPGRYTCHDLLRSYAAEEAASRETEADRRAAVYRVLDHYSRAALAASGFLYPAQAEVVPTPPRPGVTLEEISGAAQAADWFESEQHVLLAMIRQAAEGDYAPYAWELPWIVGWYFRDEACWQELATTQESALAVAARLGDVAGLTLARQHLGWLRFLLGEFVSACRHLNDAVRLTWQLDDGQLHALARLSRAYVLRWQDRMLESDHAGQAPQPYTPVADPGGESSVLYGIGWYLIQLGDHQKAAEFSRLALEAYRESFCAAES